MARLELNEVLERLQSQTENPTLQRARRQDARLKLHTEPHTDSLPVSDAFRRLSAWIQSLIEPSKYNTFLSILRFPIGTVEVTDSAFSKVEKIFESDGFFIDLQFNNPELVADAMEFRDRVDAEFWRRDAFATFKSAINSFLVVDVEQVQEGNFPEAYYNMVEVKHVIDVRVRRDEVCEWILFYDYTTDLFVQVDQEFYRTFIFDQGRYELVTETSHDLGYCPARAFWSDRITPKNWQKQNIITPSLANLDWLFLLQEGQKHLEEYGTWPIFSAYEQKCDYRDEETGAECVNGKLMLYPTAEDASGLGQFPIATKDCPNCTNKHLFGPGSSIEAVAPSTKEDPDTLTAVKWIEAPIESLKIVEEKIKAKSNQIIYNSIGQVNEPTKEAINEMQVMAGFEDRETVLNNVVENFELVHRWALKTLMKLRYGDQFLGLVLNYGRKHSLRTVDQLKEGYEKAREAGIPFFELESMRDNIFSTQYKNNPAQRMRSEILSQIEPYQDYSIEELSTLFDKGLVNTKNFVLKSNFTNFIKRFERENLDIVSFMSGVPMDVKIELIKNQLDEYVDEQLEQIDLREGREDSGDEDSGDGADGDTEQATLTGE